MFALVDGNNFYVSCERLFNPSLEGVPVVVLSNNDGCLIARSDEARELGLEMGDPYFKAKPLLDRHGVRVFSSNYALYGDVSRRLMELLGTFSDEQEIYSIDECFLGLRGFGGWDMNRYAATIRAAALHEVGLPCCVGVAPTKTLAKLANRLAKKESRRDPSASGVWVLDSDAKRLDALRRTEVAGVWGIGQQYAQKLLAYGITHACDLARVRPAWANKHLGGVTGERLVAELGGVSCLPLELAPAARQSVACTRSFGRVVRDAGELSEAVSTYAAKASEKLRGDGTLAGVVTVFIQSGRFGKNPFSASVTLTLPAPTADPAVLTRYALEGLKRIFKPGISYGKAGVVLAAVVPANVIQTALFGGGPGKAALTAVVDRLNARYGSGTVFLASEGTQKQWRTRSTMRSHRYTTRWKELPVAKA